ncbi:MAG: hypothetical protein FD132_1990 [bacterium]|nr:MAG: hypothetical protein FD132_1990 [bacterium]
MKGLRDLDKGRVIRFADVKAHLALTSAIEEPKHPIGAMLFKRRARSVMPTEVRRIEAVVLEYEAFFLEKWHEHNHG